MTAREITQTLAIILAAGLVSELVAGIVRLPRMVVLLAVGAILGPSVTDAVDVPLDNVGIELLLTLGVSFILFYGGLGLSATVLSRVAVGLGMLAVPGVVLTCVVTGAVAAWAFGLPFENGLLIGAVLAPTDPAILIPLFERLEIRPKVSQTIVAESALNDPTGAALALTLAAFVVDGGSLGTPLVDFLEAVTLSTLIGVAIGLVLAILISDRRIGVWSETPAIAVMLIVAAGYFTIDSVGGSGYLGAFIAGAIVGNIDMLGLRMIPAREQLLEGFVGILADVVVIFVFVVLGANLPFESFPEHAPAALATVAALILVARPLTVMLCLGLDRRGRWTRAEAIFLTWSRETGVVPAAVAALLVAQGTTIGDELTTTVAVAIIVTLVVQSTTKRWLAERLGLVERPAPAGAVGTVDNV
ncbi:MAG: cation:proton antiporter [Gaiellales bacterium]